MTAAVINDNSSGAWTRGVGDPVEVLDLAANGRSVLIKMLPDAAYKAKAGRKCWLPASWVDGLRPAPAPEPERCPTCGQLILEET